MAKSDWIAQGMAESAAWRQGIRNLINALEYTYTQCAHGSSRRLQCVTCVLQNVLGCKTVYVFVCACVCASRLGAKFQDVIFSTLKA